MKKYRMNIFCLLFLLILFSAALLFTKNNVFKEAGSININAGVQDAINNLDQYADYFKDNQWNAEIVTYDDKECLKIKFASDVEALYGPDLIKINNKILYQYYDKEYFVNIEIYNIDLSKKTARVSTEYNGGYGTTVCYYLPDFYDMKPDWGDYLQADLDIKKIISKEELKELYCTAEQMKEMINNEYMRQNQTK